MFPVTEWPVTERLLYCVTYRNTKLIFDGQISRHFRMKCAVAAIFRLIFQVESNQGLVDKEATTDHASTVRNRHLKLK